MCVCGRCELFPNRYLKDIIFQFSAVSDPCVLGSDPVPASGDFLAGICRREVESPDLFLCRRNQPCDYNKLSVTFQQWAAVVAKR